MHRAKPEDGPDPALRISGAVKRYGPSTALAGLDLELAPGEWLGFLGANGAGKTTTMLAVAGLIGLDEGRIDLYGRTVSGPMPDVVGWVPQEIALYPHLTARENLKAFGRLHGLRGQRLAHALRWALEWTGLESRADELVAVYSSGMRRRLNIGCGVLHRPRVLLLDEPTVGVDPQARKRILAMLDELRRDGTALLQSTHEFGDVEAMCNRLVIMDRGRAIASGTLHQLVLDHVGDRALLTLKVEGDPPPEGLGPKLRRDGSTWSASIDDVAADLPRLLDSVRRAGCRIAHLDVRRPGLTEVFMQLTGRDLRE